MTKKNIQKLPNCRILSFPESWLSKKSYFVQSSFDPQRIVSLAPRMKSSVIQLQQSLKTAFCFVKRKKSQRFINQCQEGGYQFHINRHDCCQGSLLSKVLSSSKTQALIFAILKDNLPFKKNLTWSATE